MRGSPSKNNLVQVIMQIEPKNASQITAENSGKRTDAVPGSSGLHQAREFLATVLPWPQNGEDAFIDIIWTFKSENYDKPGWGGRAVKSVDQAVKTVEWALTLPDTRDLYVCLSSQRVAQEATTKKGHTYLKPVRSQANAVALKSLYLDIDVKPSGNGYASMGEAVAALRDFLGAANLPKASCIVKSGGGLHVYLTFAHSLRVEQWKPLAFALVEATKRHGLKCDVAVTTDSARILRVAGTWNRKTDPPRPVTLVGGRTGPNYSVERIQQALEPYKVALSSKVNARAFIEDMSLFPPKPPLQKKSDLSAGIIVAMSQADVRACLDAIPNPASNGWKEWNDTGMRVYAATEGADYGLEEWQRWSDKHPKVNGKEEGCAERWAAYHHSPPTRTGAGALVNEARRALGDPSWMPVTVKVTGSTPQEIADPDPSSFADPWADFVGPPFPLDVLPPPLANFVDAENRAMGADPSALAMAVLTAVAGALHADTCLRMGDGWYEKPIIWTGLIGQPSAMKSPIIQKVTKPLHKIDQHRAGVWQSLNAGWQQAKAAKQNPGPPPPKPPRCLIQDGTPEKIAEILSRAPRGSMMVYDELAGWIGSFERYSSGPSARAFYLTCWNGGPFLKDRVGQGVRDTQAEIRVDNLALCMLGGIQPDRLAAISDLTSDGLLQRFLPVLMRSAKRSDEDYHVTSSETAYGDLISRIQGTMAPCSYQFASDAMEVRTRVLDRLFELEQLDGFSSSLTGAIGKLKGYYARIALVLHAATEHDSLMRGQIPAIGAPIPRQVAEAAERVVMDFLLPHVFGLYDFVANGGKDRETIRAVAGFILGSDKDRLRPSDFTTGVRKLKGEPQHKIMEWAGRFCALGWLKPEDETAAVPKAWVVIPGLREHFAQRREQVRTARAAAHAILRAGGSRRPS